MALFQKTSIAEVRAPPFEELRRRTRILVIDDDESSFPFKQLKDEGYAIDHWPKVQSLTQLEQGTYDIVVLDIHGVGQEYSADDGLGILEHIKERNPSQLVVAFSGHTFDLAKNRFFRLADDVLGKPVDATKCKRVIDDLIASKMTPQGMWERVKFVLSEAGLSQKDISKLESKVAVALKKKDGPSALRAVEAVVGMGDAATRIAKLVLKLVTLVGLVG